MIKFIKPTLKQILHILSVTAVVAMTTQGTAVALGEQRRNMFDLGINYYDPSSEICSSTVGTDAVDPGPVYLIGDSITDPGWPGSANAKLQEKFTGGWSITINSAAGRFPHEAPALLETDRAVVAAATTVIVELGANVDNDFAAEQTAILAKIKEINPAARIMWVNIGSNTNGTGKDGTSLDGILLVDEQTVEAYSAINGVINNQATPQGYKVINWFNVVFPDGDATNIDAALEDTNNYLSNDKLHPTEAGAEALANKIFADVTTGQGGSDAVSGGGIDTLPSSVPEPYKSIFEDAAAAHDTDLAALTAAYLNESIRDFGDPPPPYGNGPPWVGNATAGAAGPFQFIPDTWASVGEDASGDGVADVNDLKDAAFTGAKYLTSVGGKKGNPFGNPDPANPYSDDLQTIVESWIAYNWGPGHVSGRDLPLPTETQNYIRLGTENYQNLVGGIVIAGGAGLNCSGSTGGLGVSPDGFVFPQQTTKAAILEGISGAVWCHTSQTNCHHDYNAADIFNETGTPVVASKPGTVAGTRNQAGGAGSYVFIKGDDQFVYYYGHMGVNTVQVGVGDHVNAGDKLGEVGTDADAEGTPRHTHFDILPPEYDYRVSCSSAECTGYPFVNVQPLLIAAFAALPEN